MFNLPNFGAIENPYQPKNKGMDEIFSEAQDTRKKSIENRNLPDKLAAELLKQQLENQIQAPNARRAEEITSANLAEKMATAFATRKGGEMHERELNYPGSTGSGLTSQAVQAALLLKQHPELKDLYKQQQDIIGAGTENLRNRGLGRSGVGIQGQVQLMANVKRDNPSYTDDQAFEAAGHLMNGEYKMDDGSDIVASGLTKGAASYLATKNTPSKLITAGVQANQADAELKAIQSVVSPIMKEIGTTYFNRSPDLLIASMSSDKSSQLKVGRAIGARALQYAIAQLRNRIDMGEPGINATRELMDSSGQIVNIIAPSLDGEARAEAQRIVDKGVQEALNARNKYGVSATGAAGKNSSSSIAKNPTEMTDAEIRAELGLGAK